MGCRVDGYLEFMRASQGNLLVWFGVHAVWDSSADPGLL